MQRAAGWSVRKARRREHNTAMVSRRNVADGRSAARPKGAPQAVRIKARCAGNGVSLAKRRNAEPGHLWGSACGFIYEGISTLLLVSLFLFYPAMAATSDPLTPQNHVEQATFAGGCFWCMQHPFDKLKGVISTKAGYTGGQKNQPTYNEVSAGGTGHAESVQIEFDPSKISYQQLLDVFWRQINPTDAGGQFVDRGSQYRTVIFYHSDKQRQLAEQSRDVLETSGRFGKPIVTRIVPAATFWPAEEYHQHYADKNPLRYQFYRYHSGRDQYLDRIWGKHGEH